MTLKNAEIFRVFLCNIPLDNFRFYLKNPEIFTVFSGPIFLRNSKLPFKLKALSRTRTRAQNRKSPQSGVMARMDSSSLDRNCSRSAAVASRGTQTGSLS